MDLAIVYKVKETPVQNSTVGVPDANLVSEEAAESEYPRFRYAMKGRGEMTLSFPRE